MLCLKAILDKRKRKRRSEIHKRAKAKEKGDNMTETVFMNKIAAFIFWHRHIGQTINRSRLIFIFNAKRI